MVKGPTMTLRLFIAIELDHAAKRALGRLIERLDDLPAKVRWVRPEQMHLTLRFLGETPAEQVHQIAAAMQRAASGVEPFEFVLRNVGGFPDLRRPRVIWVGVDEPTGALARLYDRLTAALAELGYQSQDRAFTAHITLGRVQRVSGDCERAQAAGAPFAGPEQFAEELLLFSSELTPDGPRYSVVARAVLGQGEGQG